MRQKETALNAALKTANTKTICLALDDLVRGSSSVSRIAKEAEIDRSVLYRSFRGKKGPRLSLAIRVLRSEGFQLIVKFERQPKKIKPNRFGRGAKTTAYLKLRDNSKASAEFLTRAFESSDIAEIRKALESVLRAQENVVEFAKRASLERSSLYRSFSQRRDPQLTTVVDFLSALGLRFAVKPLSSELPDQVRLGTTRQPIRQRKRPIAQGKRATGLDLAYGARPRSGTGHGEH
jgi:probable addiction module antidote protein